MPTLASGVLTDLEDRGIALSVSKNKKLNKDQWKQGSWDDEWDNIKWTDPVTNFACWIRRNSFGALCGYVGVPEYHTYYKHNGDSFNAPVHGGITFSDHIEKYSAWWFGFDCAHHMDLTPQLFIHDTGTYKNINFVAKNIIILTKYLNPENILERKIMRDEHW